MTEINQPIPASLPTPTTRLDVARKYSWLLFAFAMFSVYLPFIDLSVGGETVLTQNGLRLVFGGPTMVLNRATKQMEERDYKSIPQAVWPVALLTAAFAVSIFRRKTFFLISGLLGASGLIALLLLKARLQHNVDALGNILIFREGFWLCGALLEAAVVLQFMHYSNCRTSKS